MYRIELINKKTKQVINYDDVVDLNDGEKMFFKFQINTKQLDDGEYTLNLYDDDTLIKTDTLNVGDFNAKALQYKRGEDIYVETKIDVELTNKFVELTDINSTVYPDDGIDGMLSVTVDATPLYNRGVEDGYQNGREDGIEEQRNKLSSITITENDTYINEDGYNEIVVDVLPKLQEKSVNVTDNNTTVTADEEFDGIKSVEINATPVYNNAYNVGKSDGIEEQKSKLSSITINRNGTYNKEDGYNEVTVDVKTQSYSYLTNTVDEDGLRQLGWGDDDINYFKDNNLHYEWENDSYNVTPENIALKERIKNLSDLKNLKTDLNFIYAPYVDAEGVSEGEGFLNGAKNLKAIPLYNFRIFRANNMFSNCPNLTTIPLLNTSKATTMNNMFYNCTNLTTIPLLDTSNVTDMCSMFNGCTNLTTIPLLNTSNVTNMSFMFKGCTTLTTIPPLNTSNVTDMIYMFNECASLTSIPLLNTSNVTDMTGVFQGCKNLTTIPLLNTSNVTTMKNIFTSCTNLTSIPLLNTSNVTDMIYMFSNCSSLTSIPLLNTSNVTDMTGVFQGCGKLTTISPLDISNATNISYMFYTCSSLTTIPPLNTSNVTKMNSMFYGCSSLTSIPLLDTSNVTDIGSFMGYSEVKTLTDLGGFKNLKIDWKDNNGLARLPNLTKQSVLNVINNLYDFRANGDSTTTKTLKLHKNSLALLSDDEKAIATAKGWVLTN